MGTFDLIGSVELTLSAAIVIVMLSVALGRNVAQWMTYSMILLAWFVVVVVLATTGALQSEHGIGTAGLGLTVAVPIVLMAVAAMRVSSLREGVDHAPLAVLAGVNVVRILGVSFLILHANNRLPAPFAPVAGWGDIIAGLAAVPVAWLVNRRGTGWQATLAAWNLYGLADLVAAVALGMLSAPGPLQRIFAPPGAGLMSTLPWLLIPGFLVPLLMMTHLAIFYRLAKAGAWLRIGQREQRFDEGSVAR